MALFTNTVYGILNSCHLFLVHNCRIKFCDYAAKIVSCCIFICFLGKQFYVSCIFSQYFCFIALNFAFALFSCNCPTRKIGIQKILYIAVERKFVDRLIFCLKRDTLLSSFKLEVFQVRLAILCNLARSGLVYSVTQFCVRLLLFPQSLWPFWFKTLGTSALNSLNRARII